MRTTLVKASVVARVRVLPKLCTFLCGPQLVALFREGFENLKTCHFEFAVCFLVVVRAVSSPLLPQYHAICLLRQVSVMTVMVTHLSRIVS